MDWLRRNRLMAGTVGIGAVVVLAIGLVSADTNAIMWSGLVVGIAVGAAIAATTGHK